jgi:hypothetical protein
MRIARWMVVGVMGLAAVLGSGVCWGVETGLRLATFDVDATPPLGSTMAYESVKRLDELTLRCRGVVLLGAGDPVVLCAVDWLGIANESHDVFRAELAKAAGTTPGRVAVHALHQHDAPRCDFTSEKIVRELGLPGHSAFEGTFQRAVLGRAVDAVREGVTRAQPITHYGWGEAVVKEVASQRRIRGVDGRIRATRWSSSKDPALKAEPEGVIDPVVSLLSFWNGDKPVAILSAYACHPQSYYRVGVPSPDFPGIARFIRGQELNGALHVHFNGAGGNVTAGKYNDGAQPQRMVLANRLALGMREAFEATKKEALTPQMVGWSSVPVRMPLAPHLKAGELLEKIQAVPKGTGSALADQWVAQLAFLKRLESGHAVDVSCLRVGTARMLHLPGELFVEYQLAAKAMRKDLQVLMAAYGDYGPAYIGTSAAYPEGGYETGATASNVAPEVEGVLMRAMEQLLEAPRK